MVNSENISLIGDQNTLLKCNKGTVSIESDQLLKISSSSNNVCINGNSKVN